MVPVVDREPLSLPPGEFRRLAHVVADLVADHLEGIRELPPLRPGPPGLVLGYAAMPEPAIAAAIAELGALIRPV